MGMYCGEVRRRRSNKHNFAFRKQPYFLLASVAEYIGKAKTKNWQSFVRQKGDLTLKSVKNCGLNRDTIKYIAMFTMLLNHISSIFLERGTFLAELFQDVGYFTAPVMCWFLVEGYQYTRSKKNYAVRLFLFAVLSELPFCLAFSHGGEIRFIGLNMLFTLFFCFLILAAEEKISNCFFRVLTQILLVLVTVICDWPLIAAICTIMFSHTSQSRKKAAFSFGAAALLFAFLTYGNNSYVFPADEAVWRTFCASLGVIAAGVVLLCFYNGKRAERGRTFSKWFFYLFYPVHLLILALINICLVQ